MPAIAQVSVNFATVLDVQNLTSGSALQVSFKSISPLTLARYCLIDGEYNDPNNLYNLSNPEHLKYVGGFLTSGNKINVKYGGDLTLRNSLFVNKNIIVGPINPGSISTTYGGDTIPKFTITSTLGDFITEGSGRIKTNLELNGNLSIGPNSNFKLLVDSATGNTIIRGTTSIRGDVIIDSNNETVDAARNLFIDSNTGNIDTKGEVKIRGDLHVTPTSADTVSTRKFHVDSDTGNTTSLGTLDYTNGATLRSTLNVYGNVVVGNVTGTQNTRFSIDSTNGNTYIEGILDVKNDLRINFDKFTISSSNGNTQIEGTLNVKNIISVGSGDNSLKRVTGLSNKDLATFLGTTRDSDAINIHDIKYFTTPVSKGSTAATDIYIGRRTTDGKPEFRKIIAGNNIQITTDANDNIVVTNTAPLGLYLNLTGYSDTEILNIINSILPPSNFGNGTILRVYSNRVAATTTGTTVAAGTVTKSGTWNVGTSPSLTWISGIGAIGATRIRSWNDGSVASFGTLTFTGTQKNISATTNLSRLNETTRTYVSNGSSWVQQ